MVKLEIAVEESGAVAHTLVREVAPEQTVTEVARSIAEEIGVSLEEALADLYENEELLKQDAPICECAKHTHHWRLKLVCVEIHFETEVARHLFSAQAKWEQVHRWAVRHFQIAADVSANLELHRDTPTGPMLNERAAIGHFKGCLDVWLVKPGPENNGRD